ncbi:YqcC family protein [Edaphovirga cremea]|uniref:YqcC family protein n=1 Tax=Edaphovirga cremea TaxID=2267246 RepID=UPI0039898DEB
MTTETRVRQSLLEIEQEMRDLSLWQSLPPEPKSFESVEPFCVDTMNAEQWLQWVLIPRMHALLDQNAPLPTRFAITPYFEMAFNGVLTGQENLMAALQRLDDLLNKED